MCLNDPIGILARCDTVVVAMNVSLIAMAMQLLYAIIDGMVMVLVILLRLLYPVYLVMSIPRLIHGSVTQCPTMSMYAVLDLPNKEICLVLYLECN